MELHGVRTRFCAIHFKMRRGREQNYTGDLCILLSFFPLAVYLKRGYYQNETTWFLRPLVLICFTIA